MKKTRIALLSFIFPEYCIQLGNALSEKAELYLLLPERHVLFYRDCIAPAVRAVPFRLPRLRSLPSNVLMIRKVLSSLGDISPEIVHLQVGHPWFNLKMPALSRKYPFVTTVHDVNTHTGDRESKKFIFRDLAIRYSDHFIVHGQWLRQQFISKYGVPEKRVHAVHHGVYSIYRHFIREDFDEEKSHVLFFGRIWDYKGLEYLIRAEPIISREIRDVKITIAGTGDNFEKYDRMMINRDRYNILNRYIDNGETAELFQKASVVVLPYVGASQSGVVPLAYAFSKPVVVTDVGSLSEVVEQGRTGFVVPPRDSERLADAIITLLKNDDLRCRMKKNITEKVDGELNWERIADKTLGVYEEALEGRK